MLLVIPVEDDPSSDSDDGAKDSLFAEILMLNEVVSDDSEPFVDPDPLSVDETDAVELKDVPIIESDDANVESDCSL